jgi:hypothetical protein
VSLHQDQIDEKTHASINKSINRARRIGADDGKTNKYSNGYLVFYKERFPEARNGGDAITAIAKKLGAEWKALSAEEKQVFNDRAKSER